MTRAYNAQYAGWTTGTRWRDAEWTVGLLRWPVMHLNRRWAYKVQEQYKGNSGGGSVGGGSG